MRIAAVVIVAVCLLAPPARAEAQQDQAGFRTVNIPGWNVVVKQDPFTDAWEAGAAFGDGIAVFCDPTGETRPSGLQILVSILPALFVETAEVEYRVGRGEPQTGTWSATWGSGGSTITVPDSLVADVLRAGRLAVRVQGQHTRLLEWDNGDSVYELLSECADWER